MLLQDRISVGWGADIVLSSPEEVPERGYSYGSNEDHGCVVHGRGSNWEVRWHAEEWDGK